MKTRFLFILLVFTCIGYKANAQYVSIPDTNFGKWLHNRYAGCMTGISPHYNLDTTCAAVLAEDTIECSNQRIHNLTGIQYFKNITYLNSDYNSLGTLGTLPPNIISMTCQHDTLSSILAFPPHVTDINVGVNYLTSIPALPTSVQFLSAIANQLTALPTLPANLRVLNISVNNFTNSPNLPSQLIGYSCSTNHIHSFPNPLPSSLTTVDFSLNPLHSLPTLPAGLTYLDCSADSLSALPTLPVHLQLLHCQSNFIDSFPNFPSTLGTLEVSSNPMRTLPTIPNSVTALVAQFCPLLESLPNFPDSLFNCYLFLDTSLKCLPEIKKIVNLEFTSTGITCLPSYGQVVNSNPPLSSLPLCDMFNPNACHMAWNLSGNVYQDNDSDCYFSRYPDARLDNMKVMLYSGGVLQQQFFTNDGFYSFNVHNTWGTYVTKLDTYQRPFSIRCPANDSIVSSINAIDSFLIGEDYAMKCQQGFDVGAFDVLEDKKLVPRPGTYIPVTITAGDLANQYGAYCSAGISGKVQVIFSSNVIYAGSVPGALTPDAINGDTLVWNIADFSQIVNNLDFKPIMQIATNATGGSQACFDVRVTPAAGDNDTSNNHLQYCFTIVNALDPNEKEVFPAGDVDTSQEWLTYTVRFQNTGNAPALNIYVTDTLSTNVDASSIQLVSYSHKNYTQVLEGGILRFNFPNINLPDSTTNEPASHGYVRYKVKLKRGLPYGTEIKNTANIFFDLNPAVVTNTTITKLAKDTVILPGIANVTNHELAITVYPNPATDLLNIATDVKGTMIIRLLDINGAEVMAQTSANQTTIINISNLSKGMYFVEVRSNGMLTRKKVVKM